MDFPEVCVLPLPGGSGKRERGREINQRHPEVPPTIFLTAPQALSITSVDQIVFAANPRRRYLEIQNQSGTDWVIAFDSKAIQGFGLIIPSGDSRIFDGFTIPKSEIHLILYSINVLGPFAGIGIEGFV